MIQVPVNKILDHSLVDGPGNRTVIFLQRCNLACQYCHNPETQQLCCHCGQCVPACPAGALKTVSSTIVWDKGLCVSCDKCIKICPNYSSPKITEMTVDEVLAAITANLPFIRGITVSGGECALYLPFLVELFTKCQRIGLTCLIDSNGTIPLWDDRVMAMCDGVMLDVKAWDGDVFFRLTEGHNDIVKENLRELALRDKLAELRVVCFEQEDLVDVKRVITGISSNVTQSVKEHTLLKLIRFRNIGVIGSLNQVMSPSPKRMEDLRQFAVKSGFQKIRIV